MNAVLIMLFMAGQVASPPPPLPAASEWRNGGTAAGSVMEASGPMAAATAWLKNASGCAAR